MKVVKRKWNSIVEKSVLISKLELITKVLEQSNSDKGFSLFGGSTGIALFFYYYYLLTKDEKYLEKGNSIIIKNFDLFNNSNNEAYSLCGGRSGFMWAINHLITNGFIEGNCNELFLEKEITLQSSMMQDIKIGKYDYLHNALGAGLYLSKRNNKESIKYVESLIYEIEKWGEKDGTNIRWRSDILDDNGNKDKEVYNIGLSHGIPSIIVFLVKAYQSNILKEITEKLLNGAVNYLLSIKADTQVSFYGSFPHSINVIEDFKPIFSRLAWCYGDLGVGIALWQASQALKRPEWEEIAINVLVKTTFRKDPIKEGVLDAPICHGSAGTAHIYNRMYQYTGMEVFKESSIVWIHDTLNKSVYDNGLAGYKTYRKEKYGGLTNIEGLLEGIAGIGLVLISAISDIEPKWDECLLLS